MVGHRETPYAREENQQCNQTTIIIAVITTIIAVITTIIVWLAAQNINQPCSEVSSVRACPALWINYEGKCYFFSEEKGDWASSQIFCDSHNSALAVIDSEQEKAFILRYIRDTGHWIGLRKDSGQTWKWGNGEEFKNTLELKGNGECAFLSTDFAVSDCHVAKNWICSQPDTYTRSRG
ncbi:early activation antigen CD69 isoform X2 [Zootoca vivipara]|uniref:early activation antigen CD69 isoform X2 n=1 Tax=Zootoca vivipara TaxID=8524 RepID=UPI00293BEF80|nr:early activation antigen CD69 isoform X2 [Zootoca vivipara]XP_060127189.1 early activation antigen CD69 isoform X2 [Zootoca vivipara]